MYEGPRPSDEEFERLKKVRDEAIKKMVEETWAKHFPDTPKDKLYFHASETHGCYCSCPDGPCQHIWSKEMKPVGLEEGESEDQANCWSTVCTICGTPSMSHDMRFMP